MSTENSRFQDLTRVTTLLQTDVVTGVRNPTTTPEDVSILLSDFIDTALANWIVRGTKNLTDAATSLFEVTLPSGGMFAGLLTWGIIASNGTDHQAFHGINHIVAINKAATITSDVSDHTIAPEDTAKIVNSGTLTAAFSILNGTNKITVRVTPAGSLTETTYAIQYSLLNHSPQTITKV